MKKIGYILLIVLIAMLFVGCNSDENKVFYAGDVEKLIANSDWHSAGSLKEARDALYSLELTERQKVKNIYILCDKICKYNERTLQKEFESYNIENRLKDILLNPNSLQLNSKIMVYSINYNSISCYASCDYSAMNQMGGYGRDMAYYKLTINNCEKYWCTKYYNVPEIYDDTEYLFIDVNAVESAPASGYSYSLDIECHHAENIEK